MNISRVPHSSAFMNDTGMYMAIRVPRLSTRTHKPIRIEGQKDLYIFVPLNMTNTASLLFNSYVALNLTYQRNSNCGR